MVKKLMWLSDSEVQMSEECLSIAKYFVDDPIKTFQDELASYKIEVSTLKSALKIQQEDVLRKGEKIRTLLQLLHSLQSHNECLRMRKDEYYVLSSETLGNSKASSPLKTCSKRMKKN